MEPRRWPAACPGSSAEPLGGTRTQRSAIRLPFGRAYRQPLPIPTIGQWDDICQSAFVHSAMRANNVCWVGLHGQIKPGAVLWPEPLSTVLAIRGLDRALLLTMYDFHVYFLSCCTSILAKPLIATATLPIASVGREALDDRVRRNHLPAVPMVANKPGPSDAVTQPPRGFFLYLDAQVEFERSTPGKGPPQGPTRKSP